MGYFKPGLYVQSATALPARPAQWAATFKRSPACMTVHRRIAAVLEPNVGIGQVHVPPHHLEGRVFEDALERERVPAVHEVVNGEGVAE